jgi:hypothetical protein
MRRDMVRRVAQMAIPLVLVGLGIGAGHAAAAGDANMAECPQTTEESPGFRSYLPDCRAYELVSPAYTAGFEVVGGLAFAAARVSASGETVGGVSLGGFAGAPDSYIKGESPGTPYLFHRGDPNWGVETIMPAVQQLPSPEFFDISVDLQRSLWVSGGNTSFAEQTEPDQFFLRDAAGQFVSVGPVAPIFQSNRSYRGASADLGRVAFVLGQVAGNPSPYWSGDKTVSSGEAGNPRYSLYEYAHTEAGEPSLVGVNNSESLEDAAAKLGKAHINEAADQITQCGTALGYSGVLPLTENIGDLYNAVSSTGFGIFFTAFAGGCTNGSETGTGPTANELYLRVEGEKTVALSEPLLPPGAECTGPCAAAEPKGGEFAGASANGHTVFFTTEQPLLNSDEDTAKDLYMEEIVGTGQSAHVSRIAQVSHDPNLGQKAEVAGVVRVAEDGSRVYFVAKGVLTEEANGNLEAAEAGKFNLYMYDRDTEQVAFVTKLAATDTANGIWGPLNAREAQVTAPNGRFLVFVTKAHPLNTGDVSGNGSNVGQLFRYDAESGALVRVSIGQQGSFLCSTTKAVEQGYNCNGNVASNLRAPKIRRQTYLSSDEADQPYKEINVTPEGAVFFESTAALTPGAVNGFPNLEPGFKNVYEYRNGNVYLISDGVEPASGFNKLGVAASKGEFISVTNDGGALFLTADSLVPQDTNVQTSIYDAHVGGGFPSPPGTQQCAGGSCRGAGSSAGSMATAASTSAQSLGNVHPRSKHRKKHKRRKPKPRTHKAQRRAAR